MKANKKQENILVWAYIAQKMAAAKERRGKSERKKRMGSVSYTHLDVYKRQE